MSGRTITLVAGIAGLLAVLAGTFGTHGLEGRIEQDLLETWEIEIEMPPVQLRVTGLLDAYRLRDTAARRVLKQDLGTTTIHIVRFGPVLCFGIPADVSTSIGMPVLEHARRAGFVPLIMSMSNEWIGYLFTEDWRLIEIIDEIELRAAVEIAKMERYG